MKMARPISLFVLAALSAMLAAPAFSRGGPGHVKVTAKFVPADVRAGETAQIVVTATMDDTWHIYSTNKSDVGVPTKIQLEPGSMLVAAPKIVQPDPEKKHDKDLGDYEVYEGAVSFAVPVKVDAKATGAQKATVSIKFQTCDPSVCLPPETVKLPIEFKVASGTARANRTQPVLTVPTQPAGYKKPAKTAGISKPPDASPAAVKPAVVAGGTIAQEIGQAQRRGLLAFIWLSLAAGFAALLTPCVFPMIPITVSYFAKRKAANQGSMLTGPVAYCVGIIGTWTGLGLLFSVVFGATKIQSLAASPITNLALGILFVVLAANLFGAFEIALPSGLVNKAQSGTRAGGFVGPMLMGLTFTLTSFTCTVPFVGTLLVTASQGSKLYPIVGMLAFSTAFALPFFLLALFPQYLSRMPKSGGWLVSVKAFMGFLELAAALKFISNADLVWRWGILTQPVFLAIWAAVAAVAALYLLGWLRLPHDAEGLKIGLPRRILALGTGFAAVYLLAAMNGRSLGQLDAFLPPDIYPGKESKGGGAGITRVDWTPGGYAGAVTLAKSSNKPIFINFTGYT